MIFQVQCDENANCDCMMHELCQLRERARSQEPGIAELRKSVSFLLYDIHEKLDQIVRTLKSKP